LKRVYYSFEKWEDYQFGMWRKIPFSQEPIFLEAAIRFTGDAELYGKYMIRAINEWPNGCEHNLTCVGMNRQAWIGHAATCIALTSPEYITRLAWHQLTQEQQDLANAQADIAIKIWEDNYAKDKDWNRRSDSSPAPDFVDVRQIREGLSLLQRGKGQYSNAAPSSGGSPKKEKKIRYSTTGLRGAIQAHYRPCDRLF
jgi:hypothetical protein